MALSGLQLDIVESLEAAEAVAPEWDALADEVGSAFTSRPTYGLAWYRHVGKGRLLSSRWPDETVGWSPSRPCTYEPSVG